MKKYLLFFLVTLLGAILFNSCSKKVHTQRQEAQWKPRGPLFFVAPSGVYKGAVPCTDCPGVEVTLNFNDDNSVVKSMRYIKSTNKNSKSIGTWVVTAGNIVQVTYNQKLPQEYYKAQNGGHLVMLNSKKELNINPSQAQFFIFNRY